MTGSESKPRERSISFVAGSTSIGAPWVSRLFAEEPQISIEQLTGRQDERRDFWDVRVLAFPLLFLELEGNTTNWSFLNTLHQVSGETSNLVTKTPVTRSACYLCRVVEAYLEPMMATSSMIALLVCCARGSILQMHKNDRETHEINSQTGVVVLNGSSGSPLDCLRTYATLLTANAFS